MKNVVGQAIRGTPALSAAAVMIVGLGLVVNNAVILAATATTSSDFGTLIEILVLYGIVCLFAYSVIIFCVAEYGCVWCRLDSAGLLSPESESFYDGKARRDLLLLVPSYKEDEEFIRRALISAALVEYPGRRVVLLIDDPPTPTTSADARILTASRQLPGQLQALFAIPARHLSLELSAYHDRAEAPGGDVGVETRRLARLYRWAADWLDTLARDFGGDRPGLTHTERLFIDRILLAPARLHRERASEVERVPMSVGAIGHEYRRLAGLFQVEFGCFERKRYANLSHAPNKAMNLNSYIALVGKGFREVARQDGLHLEACDDGQATLHFPAADYIATLDADSLMTSDYAVRLVAILEEPGNERVAIAQTPYTAMPNPPDPIERAASASTDAQFFNHQGMARLGASFWVGASALMRRAALEDIGILREERGHEFRVYIDDQILIEDAAATVDLLDKGWRVHHDEGRLAYSATPADFGALLIQRRRWANGGLLILPRLLRHTSRRPWSFGKLAGAILRIPNLIAASLAGIGLPIMLLYPFDNSLLPLWIPLLLAGPYCLLYGLDLTRAGYRWTDLPRVVVLNVLLIPVNLGGTLQSLRQAFSGQPIPFRRTPKVSGRTRTPLAYLIALYGFCAFALLTAVVDGMTGRYAHILFPLLGATAAAYGIAAFVGVANSRDDLLARIASRKLGRRRALALLGPLRP